jgi:VanZ family protein
LTVTLTRVSHLIGWVGVIAIIVLSLLPGGTRPRMHLFTITQWEHFAAYIVTAALLAQGRTNRAHYFLIGLFLSALAAVLEVGQIWVPGRDAKLSDWVAGASGAWTGVAIWPIVLATHARAHALSQRHQKR